MKKIILMVLVVFATLAATAGEYDYLTFETTDGAKASVSVDGLTLTVSGTTLTAGDQSFTLSNLSRMYFSDADETTGIERIYDSVSSDVQSATDIYDLQGKKVTKDQMIKGVYIVKSKQGTYKIAVK